MNQLTRILACVAGLAFVPLAAAVDIGAYVKKDKFEDIKLSPKGDYYAATVPLEDRTILVVLQRSDNKVTAQVTGGRNTAIADFQWVSPDRVIVSLAEKFGSLDRPQLTGELYGVDAKTGAGEILVGQRVHSKGSGKIQTKKVEQVAPFLWTTFPPTTRK